MFLSVLSVISLVGAALTGLFLFVWLYMFKRSKDDATRVQVESKLQKISALRWLVEATGFELTEPSISRLLSISCPLIVGLGAVIIIAALFLPIAQPVIFRVTLGSVVVILVSLVLFGMKITEPLIHGFLEALFALAACVWSIEAKMTDTLSPEATVTLFASAYLMIRAMDNIKKGVEERTKKGVEAQPAA